VAYLDERLLVSPDESIQMVKAYAERHATVLGFDFSRSQLQFFRATSTREGTAMRFRQSLDGLPIEGAELVASFDQAGNLQAMDTSLVNDQPAADFGALRDEVSSEILENLLGKKISKIASVSKLHIPMGDGQLRAGLRIELTASEVPFKILLVMEPSKNLRVMRVESMLHAINVKIYNGMLSPMPGRGQRSILVLDGDEETQDAKIAKRLGQNLRTQGIENAKQNFEATLAFYADELGRAGYDAAEATVHAVADAGALRGLDFFGLSSNAFWNAREKVFVFGAGRGDFSNFAGALDVVAHEYTHAVISNTSDLIYAGQPGALNEHFADAMASMTESHSGIGDPMLLGESLSTIPLRNMLRPAEGKSQQPDHMTNVPPELGPDCEASSENDQCGVHILSGIPNRAVATAAAEVGWSDLRPIIYEVMVNRLRSNADFINYRLHVLDHCSRRHGASSPTCLVLSRSFQTVGL
jgi:Zn-dependent metalloprotease